MKLLILADTLAGGLGTLAVAHARWFQQAGWEVCLAGPRAQGLPKPTNIDVVPVEVPRSIREPIGVFRAAMAFGKIVESFEPALVHCHGLRSLMIARVASGRWHAVTLHGNFSFPEDGVATRTARRLILREIPSRSPLAISVTPEVGLRGWRFLAHASPRLASILPVDLFDLSPAPVRFLWLGRLERPKTPELFVEAIGVLSKRTDRAVRGVIAGDGPLLEDLKRLAQESRAPVEFAGHVEDINQLLSGARAVVLTSRSEGIPLAIEEAMWAGLPVVASPLPGMRWLVGRAGTFAESSAQLVDALEELLDARAAVDRGREAATQVRARIALDDPWPAVSRLYEQMGSGGLPERSDKG